MKRNTVFGGIAHNQIMGQAGYDKSQLSGGGILLR